MTPLARALSTALLHFLWQGAGVALILSVALALLRRRSAQARYLASGAALALMAMLPVATMWVVYRAPSAGQVVSAAVIPTTAAAVAIALPDATWVLRIDTWALPVWALGVLFFAVRLMWGSRQVATLRRGGQVAEEAVLAVAARVAERLGLARPVGVLMSAAGPSVVGPSVVGWLRPVILLPAATLAGLTPQQFEAVLAHEIAHILRYDYLVNLLQMLVEALLFYHPAVWWVSARMRHERELCCDDLAVRVCGDAVCYARALTTLERLRVSAPALAMGSTSGRLLYRIERLMGAASTEPSPERLAARWPGLVALAAGLACFALTTNWARGQAPAPADQPGVKVDLGKASVESRTGVAYPQAAQQKGVKGNVTVEVTVDENGNVSDARVVKGPEELRKGVLASVLNWRFGQAEAKSRQKVSVEFQPPPSGAVPPAQAEGFVGDPEIERALADSQALIAQLRSGTTPLPSNPSLAAEQLKEQLAELDRELHGRTKQEMIAVQRDLAALEEQLRALRRDPPEDLYKLYQSELEAQKVQRDLARVEEATKEAQDRDAQIQTQRAREESAAHLEKARATLREFLALYPDVRQFVGRRVKNIQMLGFTDGVAKYLTPRLKVQLGDTLTPESIGTIRSAAHDYDENVTVEFVPTDDGQVELRVTEVAARR